MGKVNVTRSTMSVASSVKRAWKLRKFNKFFYFLVVMLKNSAFP